MLQSIFLSVLSGLPLVSTSPLHKRDFPAPEPCQGNCSWIHDPSIIRKDDTYYRFSTSGNIAIATAPKLSGPWQYRGALLTNGTKIQLGDGGCSASSSSIAGGMPGRSFWSNSMSSCFDIWAPDVSKIGDTYHAFYAVSRMGYQNSEIGVATSKSLDPGTWTDQGSIGLPKSADYNLIDPNLFQENGASYLMFGSYWKGIYETDLFVPPKYTVKNIISNTTANAAVVEGAFRFKHTDGSYFVFFSVGQCCRTPPNLAAPGDEYRIMVCKSQNVNGPYADQQGRSCLTGNGGTLVLGSHGDVYAPGGQGVIIDKDSGKATLYYHYVKPSVGYNADQFFFGFNYLDFSSGWPVVVR